MSETLKPCPFCGSNNVAQGASADRISVWCFCGARGPDVAFPEHCDPVPPIDECRAAWNRRSAPPAPPPATELVEALANQHEANIADLELLRRALRDLDPVPELLLRVDDLIRHSRTALAKFKEQSHG